MDVEEFQTCRRCQHPYPVFAGTSDPRSCPPCRKRARARVRGVKPDLTTSDHAYDAIHAMYNKRDGGWRNRLDGVEGELKRVTQVAGELSDENVRLREIVIRLEAAERTEIPQKEVVEVRHELRNKMREVEALRARITERDQVINALRENLRRAHTDAFTASFSEARRELNLKADLPDDVSVMDLIKLCHPDRHASGAMEGKANEVVKWLLTKR